MKVWDERVSRNSGSSVLGYLRALQKRHDTTSLRIDV
jgi:hypothetical protein